MKNSMPTRILTCLLVALLLAAALPSALAASKYCPNRETPDAQLMGHDWGKWKVKEEATCEKEGKKERRCECCGEIDTKKIKKPDHKWGEWTIIEEATDRSMGKREHTCTVCGVSKTVDFYPEGTLKRGDRGEAVKALQNALNAKGYDCGKADGSFGRKVESAVKAFEASIGFTEDGIAWPAVIAALVGQSDTKTASVRMPERTKEKIKVVIYNKVDDREIMTVTVDAGAETDFALSRGSANGQALTWVVQAQNSEYGTYPEYKKGMSFDTDVFITGIAAEDTITVTFSLYGTTVWELKVDKNVGFRLAADDPTYAIVDGKWVEWEEWVSSRGSMTVKPYEHTFYWDVLFRGTIKGVVTTIVLEEDTIIGDYGNITKNPVEVHAGDVITVLGRRGRTYVVLKPGGQSMGTMNIGSENETDLTFMYPNDDAPIYLDATGGKVDPEFLPAGTKKSDFPKPTRANYRFKEWKLEGGAGKTYALYSAQWEPEHRFTITINYGKFEESGRVHDWGKYDNYTTDYSLPYLSMQDGYVFTGWQLVKYRAPGMSAAITCDRPFEEGEPLTGDITLYARSKRGYYTVKFDMTVWNRQNSITVECDSTDYTLPTPEEKDGYEFTGWVITRFKGPDSARANANVRPFTPGQAITGDITLQAQYIQTKGAKVTLDAGEGRHVGTKEGKRIETVMTTPEGLLTKLPTAVSDDSKENFEGWYMADGTHLDSDLYYFGKDTTLYAHWSANPTVSIIKSKK